MAARRGDQQSDYMRTPTGSQPPTLTHHHSLSNPINASVPQPPHSIAPHPASGRPGLDRAHTFPTPPASASSLTMGFGSSGSSYEYGGQQNAAMHPGESFPFDLAFRGLCVDSLSQLLRHQALPKVSSTRRRKLTTARGRCTRRLRRTRLMALLSTVPYSPALASRTRWHHRAGPAPRTSMQMASLSMDMLRNTRQKAITRVTTLTIVCHPRAMMSATPRLT